MFARRKNDNHDGAPSPHRPVGRRSLQQNDDLTRKTLNVWRPRALERLETEDARTIAENMVGLFRILAEWEAKERSANAKDVSPSPVPLPRSRQAGERS